MHTEGGSLMEWTDNLRTLHRGLRIATQAMKAKLEPLVTAPRPEPGRLVGFDGFGTNPGKLRMLAHLPTTGAERPLVVLLHGCGQSAATFAADSGWMALADEMRFPLILPQQAEANNASRCFQWFHEADTARGRGEAGSIAAMTLAAIERFRSDRRRVFVVGLSAGGAMAAALLAAYPDLFAAGAAIAGLPVGSARTSMQALLRMASAGVDHPAAEWAASVKAAAPAAFNGSWPRLSVWQGTADKTVAPENADLLAEQWQALLDLRPQDRTESQMTGARHAVWRRGQQAVLEVWTLPAMAHAYPVRGRSTPGGHLVLPSPVDATSAIARFFGLD
jgi:poly(hydroxyalkanoate) depolymerase family esterase